MCEPIPDTLLFNGQNHSIAKIALYRKKRSQKEPRFEFQPRQKRTTADSDGYHCQWEVIDNCLMLRAIYAEQTTVFEPPQLAAWFCGTFVLGMSGQCFLARHMRSYYATELVLRFQHGKLVEQTINDNTAKVEQLRHDHDAEFPPLEEGKVYLI